MLALSQHKVKEADRFIGKRHKVQSKSLMSHVSKV